ncbi:MAG TPA: DMT family transporter [Mycobacterium sp.]|nr:DMT family transporter [Mycobacterium sp.]
MAQNGVAAFLALAAALLFAIGDVLWQIATHGVAGDATGHRGLLSTLLRDPRWWLGSLVMVCGLVLESVALGLGSVLLVQALLVTQLPFALPINSLLTRRRPSARAWIWAQLLAVAVAVVVTVGHPIPGHHHASPTAWAVVAAVLVPLLGVSLVAARIYPGRVAAVLLAAVSASSWSVFAVLTRGVVDLIGRGPGPLLRSPELYAWVAAAVAGTVWQQAAFRAGPLTSSLPAMTVTEPIVGVVLGVTLLGEVMRPGDEGWVAVVVAAIVMIVATVVLAREQGGPEGGPHRGRYVHAEPARVEVAAGGAAQPS